MNKLALIAGLAVSSAAMADYVVSLPTFTIGPNGTQSFSFRIPGGGNQNIAGYDFEGFYDELDNASASWASDMKLTLDAPNAGGNDAIGGFSSVGNLGTWSFDGSGSNLDGFYSQNPPKAAGATAGTAAGGVWTMSFTNDYGFGTSHTWSNVKVTIITPTPGAAALAGVAGLAAMRRRRA